MVSKGFYTYILALIALVRRVSHRRSAPGGPSRRRAHLDFDSPQYQGP